MKTRKEFIQNLSEPWIDESKFEEYACGPLTPRPTSMFSASVSPERIRDRWSMLERFREEGNQQLADKVAKRLTDHIEHYDGGMEDAKKSMPKNLKDVYERKGKWPYFLWKKQFGGKPKLELRTALDALRWHYAYQIRYVRQLRCPNVGRQLAKEYHEEEKRYKILSEQK